MSIPVRRVLLVAATVAAGLSLSGCPITLVQPYDEQLVTDTEAIFKKAASMIDEGITSSPRTDAERAAIQNPADHPAHFSKFEARYAALMTDADGLVLHALSGAQGVSDIGEKLQASINELIDQSLPSQCDDIDQEFGQSTQSLTVKNYIDLKCLLVRWRGQHSDAALTDSTGILKRANWELRKSAIFSATLAIQKAERSKER